MIDFDFDALPEEPHDARGTLPAAPVSVEDRRALLLAEEKATAAALGPGFETLSSAAGKPAWSGSGLVVDRRGEPTKPVCLGVSTGVPGIADSWGTSNADGYPFSACGVFWPLRSAATLELDVVFSIIPGALPLTARGKTPLYFRPPCVPGRSGKLDTPVSYRDAAISEPLFLHFGWRESRPGSGEATERWRVLDPSGRWLLEAFDLTGSRWVSITELAEETDFRIATMQGLGMAEGDAMPAAPGPTWLAGFTAMKAIKCHIISLAQQREAAVDRLIGQLHQVSEQRQGGVSIRARRSEAWDTRPLRGTRFEAELVRRGVVNKEKQCDAAPILGCALSHSELWYQFLQSRDPGPWVVLEDDAVLNDVRPVASLLAAATGALSDDSPGGAWDIALLGCVGQPGTQSGGRTAWQVRTLGPGVLGPVPFFIGTWGYMISRRGAQLALAELWGSSEGLTYDVDICLSNAGGEGRLAVCLTVPNVVLHPGVGGPVGRNVICYAGYEYYLHGTLKTAASTRYDTMNLSPVACERLVDRIDRRVQAFREMLTQRRSSLYMFTIAEGQQPRRLYS